MAKYDTEFAKALTYKATWSGIEITDRPTGAFGVYEHTKKDIYTNQQKGTASAHAISVTKCEPSESLNQAAFWIKLGQLVLGSLAGRCFSCAAAGVYTLVKDLTFDALVIDVVGSSMYDHHFLVMSKDGAVVNKAKNEVDWEDEAVVVDIWQGNLSTSDPVVRWKGFKYNSKENKLFASLKPADRTDHRNSALVLVVADRLIESEFSVDQLSLAVEKGNDVQISRKKLGGKGWETVTTLEKIFKLTCLDCVKGEKSVGVTCTVCNGRGFSWLTKDAINGVYGEKDMIPSTFVLHALEKTYRWQCTSCGTQYARATVKNCNGCGAQLLA